MRREKSIRKKPWRKKGPEKISGPCLLYFYFRTDPINHLSPIIIVMILMVSLVVVIVVVMVVFPFALLDR